MEANSMNTVLLQKNSEHPHILEIKELEFSLCPFNQGFNFLQRLDGI